MLWHSTLLSAYILLFSTVILFFSFSFPLFIRIIIFLISLDQYLVHFYFILRKMVFNAINFSMCSFLVL